MDSPGVSPSTLSKHGFNNIPPRTREERQAHHDHDTLEKQRLAARRGGHFHYSGQSDPVSAPEGSLAYADEHERFDRVDPADDEHVRRQRELERKAAILDKKRGEGMAREEARWAGMEEQLERATIREAVKRETVGNRRNAPSVAYNPITLAYSDNLDGVRLKVVDDTVKYHAAVRASNLYERSHIERFNIVTGEELPQPIRVPSKPAVPELLVRSGKI
ncbi:hypothetical protein KFL_001620060 [Klebsormidium nitens]|uniref:Uncharacterized protein n=1 Tax=Klebsormidium nitens TaxID=105231 RepID=A0A1Y1I6Q8_KLENI|nr:hypothetical protein KFL_001620060 [Klebsormidium nitens]|eukprot:GAQ83788.1 hypothetical protein KFL_001620060 [Klebsormidium nitens]